MLLGFVFEPLRFLLTYLLLKGIINIGRRNINLKYKKNGLCILRALGVFMLTKEELPECPVATTVQLIGNKWKLLIIRNLLYKGRQRFTDFVKTIPGISKKVLTDNLRSLEDDGLIEREVFAEVPPRVEYYLSDVGKTLKPILDAMYDWGTDYKERF